ncbi:RAMP superfamily CRISPR-associated protein [uncultured Fretibacterium sp.]|uniref:RAMP superfamily CRISPR-associated protein n=1 Tax=uncultured Fretibacterium sp. TaxID=1678694 RepID=UPI00262F6919|nr:RAMP superfamily CRISPR-associated protein [uncultured Fretibacterium sp.]
MNGNWLRLRFDSDWHVGSGAGIPGSVDRQVLRDEEGFPYVPGKSLTGILRDAAEWIADTRDTAEKGNKWKNALIGLFGEQPESHGGTSGGFVSGAAVGIGSATLSQDPRNYVQGLREDSGPDLRTALFTVRPGVKIDRTTGRALEDHLFSTERVRGCTLYAPVKYLRGPLSKDEEKLLEDAVRAVRRLGGKRRRGGGRCRLDWFNAPDRTESGKGPKTSWPGAGSSVELDFRLTTLQPVVINKVTLGNLVRSEPTLPGVSLLPWFTREVLAPLGEEELRSAVLDGSFSVGNFLPEVEGGRSLPVPLCLAREKEGKGMLNRLVSQPEKEGVQMKDLRTGYIRIEGEKVQYLPADSRRLLRTHNTVEDASQRPTEKVGGLFTYEAIRSGQTFRGTVRMSAELWEKVREKNDILQKFASSELSIGQSRKDEYGAVSLQYVPSDASAPEGRLWSPKLLEAGGKSYLVVYLISDLLIRGEFQSYSLRLEDLKGALSRALHVELSDIPDSDWINVEGRSFRQSPLGGTSGHCVRVGRRESWQTRWTLPRPSLSYFQAGSVLLFQVTNPEAWSEAHAQALVEQGLGDRRAEGYGRVLLNPPFLCDKQSGVEKLEISKETEQKEPPSAPDLPKLPEDRALILALAETLLREQFRQAARREAYELVKTREKRAVFAGHPQMTWSNAPNVSQFGMLREFAALIGDVPKRSSVESIRDWLNLLPQSSGGDEKGSWEDSWREWVRELVDDPEKIWGLSEAFEAVKRRFWKVFAKAEEVEWERLTLLALAEFWDVFCEAVFDDEKRTKGGSEE